MNTLFRLTRPQLYLFFVSVLPSGDNGGEWRERGNFSLFRVPPSRHFPRADSFTMDKQVKDPTGDEPAAFANLQKKKKKSRRSAPELNEILPKLKTQQ